MTEGAGASAARFALQLGLSLSLLVVAPTAARAGEPRAAVEVGVSAAGVADGRVVAPLRQMLAARLGEEGFRVVPVDAEPDVVVGVLLGSSDCLLRAALSTTSLARHISSCDAGTADARLELVQKATELVRTVYRQAPIPQPPASSAPASLAAAPSPTAPSAVIAVTAPPTQEASGREVAAGLDMRLHGTQVDPVVRVGVRIRRDDDWALHLTSGLSTAGSEGVSVNEWDGLVGYGRSLAEGGRLRLEATAFVGGLMHHFADGSGSGTRFNAMGALALSGTVRASRHLAIELRVAPGVVRTQYRHVVGNDVIWTGSWWRVDAGIGLVLF
jgi:hypothetical protein